jgi:hypothetical protein
MREIYRITWELSGKKINVDKQVKDKQDNVITNEKQQKRRWVEHFKEMYNKVNVNNGIEESIDMNTGKQLKINIVAPTKNEIRNAIKKTKNGRSAGTDNIPNELHKADILTAVEAFLKMLKKKIWEKEEIPRDWKEGRNNS